jgi:tetratricopeptide (TPR) repeat protein
MPEVSERELNENIILALKRRQLLSFSQESESFYMHPLVQEKAFYNLNSESFLTAHRRSYQYFVNIVKPESEWEKFDDIIPILRANYHGCQARDFDAAAMIVIKADEWLRHKGYYDLLIDLYSDLILEQEKHGERLINSSYIYVNVLCNLGHAYYFVRDYKASYDYLVTALTLSEEFDDQEDIKPKILCYLGLCNIQTPAKAIEYLQQCLKLATATANKKIKYKALEYIGDCYYKLGQPQVAANFFKESLDLAQEINFEEGEGIAFGNLGNAYRALGDKQLSISYHHQYLEISLRLGNVKSIEYALNALGESYNSVGDYQNAIKYSLECLKSVRNTLDRLIESYALRNLGVAYRGLKDIQNSISAFHKSLKLARETNSQIDEAGILYNLGVTYQEAKNFETSVEYLENSLKIFKCLDNCVMKASASIEILRSKKRISSVCRSEIRELFEQLEIMILESQPHLLNDLINLRDEISEV